MSKDIEFIDAIHQYVVYWKNKDIPVKEALEGLAFSILVCLDGMSGSFNGSRDDLDKGCLLHDMFYENRNKNEQNNV